MFRLAHISDPHLGPLPDVSWRDLASKRITGYVNWQRNRARHHVPQVIDWLVEALKAQNPDHLAVTGDLVNLALDAEIDLASAWLKSLGKPCDVSVVPGNHDAYVPGALDQACRAWAPCMAGDGEDEHKARDEFPYMRVRGRVALIGVSTALPTAPFMASGYFRAKQAEKLGVLLNEAGSRGLYRVIMIHHPPVRGVTSPAHRLFGISLFQRTVAEHGAELVLHGHTHKPSSYRIKTKSGGIPVIGVAAAGQALGGMRPAAQFNLFRISGAPGAWRTILERHGVTSREGKISQLEETRL